MITQVRMVITSVSLICCASLKGKCSAPSNHQQYKAGGLTRLECDQIPQYILVLSLASAYQMNCLPLNVGQIVLKNHAGPKDVAYQSLLAQYIAEQTRHDGPEGQCMALKSQMIELSNVCSNTKNDWVTVEKNAGGYIRQLQMDESNKNPGGRKCFNCSSPDHYKKQCPQKEGNRWIYQ